jgi:biopolymer transport protein ExbB/TolQ
MNSINRLFQGIAKSPFFWGILGSVAFFVLVERTPLGTPLVKRYFTHHPVEYMLTVMFAVGLAALLIKAFDIVAQRTGLGDSLLGAASADSQRAASQASEECAVLLKRLDRLPGRRQAEYFVCRLRAAVEHVRHHGSAETLDDELKYLSDLDAARLHAGYGLFRVIVWAIPILGFLGTVIGITMALNSVDLQSPDQSMLLVLNGLGLKFDTTALALTLSMVLMFVHFSVERAETLLLEQVDRRAQEELTGRFPTIPNSGDGQLAAIRNMTQAMLQTTEVLVRRQAELWQASVDGAAQRWAAMAEAAAVQIKIAMSAATEELTCRAAVLERAVAAAADVARLEEALNRNLAGLAGAKHFEQTALNLAAAVNMLSVHLSEPPHAGAPIRLEPSRRSAHAA